MAAWRGLLRAAVCAAFLGAASLSTAAYAQASALGINPCAALSILAPEPVAASGVIVSATQGPFRSPKPSLEVGSAAAWDDLVTITFKPIDARLAKCLEGDLTLFIDHHPLTGLAPVSRTGDAGRQVVLTYRLTRPVTSSAGWNEVMAEAWKEGGRHSVTVGIGIGNNEFAYTENALALRLGFGCKCLVCAALGLSIVALLLLSWKSRLVQDRTAGAASYSISRLILGCWVLTTLCAVVMMFLRTGTMPSASDGGLVFMLGISGATTGVSALVDVVRKPATPVGQSFSQDILNDADGLALHRLQVLAFNALVLFIVWRDMIGLGTVALIDKGWAALLGASALTFVFGKTGESTAPMIPKVEAPQAAAPDPK